MTICFHCGSEYRWVFKDGGLKPLNVSDDLAHWATCRAFRKTGKKRKGKATPQPMTKHTATITGKDYRPSCGCDVPPWEQCACSAKAVDSINNEARERLQLAPEAA